MDQINIFDILYDDFKIDKPIRLIEFFAGIGSQAKALKNLGVEFEHWHTCEWAYPSILAYNEIHHNELKDYGIDFSKDKTKDELIEYLNKKGISSNYNEPMKLEQIKRLKEEKLRNIYNAIHSTKDLVNIQQVKGQDLEIVDKDKYDYVLTYSFPCQDLSLSGKMAGMSKGSGTRSGMLWEVERILKECKDKPNVLVMENVPQVIGTSNIKDFQAWQDELEKMGYSNYVKVLNSKDYGIPQNRERCFMVSILGQYNYNFPQNKKLGIKLKDMLEDQVDDKYYLSDKQLKQLMYWKAQQEPFETLGKSISPTLTTRSGAYAAGMILTSDKGTKEELKNRDKLLKIKSITQMDIVDTNKDKEQFTETQLRMFTPDGNVKRYIGSDIVDEFKENQCADISFPNGYGHGKRTSNECFTINPTSTSSNFVVKKNLRIRKLTPKECYRLMGFSDEDYENASKVLSDAMIYHTAGDSIVVNVLMEIFRGMIK